MKSERETFFVVVNVAVQMQMMLEARKDEQLLNEIQKKVSVRKQGNVKKRAERESADELTREAIKYRRVTVHACGTRTEKKGCRIKRSGSSGNKKKKKMFLIVADGRICQQQLQQSYFFFFLSMQTLMR